MIHKNLELSGELCHPSLPAFPCEAVSEGFWKFGGGGSCFLTTSLHPAALQGQTLLCVPTKEQLCPFSICCLVLSSAKNHIRGLPGHEAKPEICLMYFTLRQVDGNLHHWMKLGQLTSGDAGDVLLLQDPSPPDRLGNSWEGLTEKFWLILALVMLISLHKIFQH